MVKCVGLFLRKKFSGLARPADGELFQLVVVAALVHLVVENGPTGTPRPSVANWLGVAHLLESGELPRPVARLARLAGGELLRLAAHLDRPARTSCSPAA